MKEFVYYNNLYDYYKELLTKQAKKSYEFGDPISIEEVQ